MNLYAVIPLNAPLCEVELVLAETDDAAMQQGVLAAAKDVADTIYSSPSAQVYLVARDLPLVGEAYATDAPSSWTWAHPAVEEAAAEEVCAEIEYRLAEGGETE